MPSEQETLDRILNIVRFKSKGMTITDLSRHTNIHRNSIAKYLQILLASGKVDVQLIGNAKVYTISRRVPISSMLSYSSDLILVINQERKIIDTNDKFLDYYGLLKENVLHKDWDEIEIPELLSDEVRELIVKGFEEGEKSGYEILFEKNGREYNFYINIIPVVLEGGSKGLTILIKDFTDQKIAEDAMVESEEKFHNLFNYAMDAIFLYEINPEGLIGNLLEVNEVASKKLQYSYDELLNLPAGSVIVPENWDISSQMDFQLAESYNSIFGGFLVKKNSDKIPVEISSQIFELNTKLVVIFIVRDITLWKEAQKKLELSEKRYKGIVENQTELICRQYPDGIFSYVNDAFCKYFNKKRDELIGIRDFIGINPGDAKEIKLKLMSLCPENPLVDYETINAVHDDGVKWIHWVTLGLYDDLGKILEYQSVGRDITAQKLAELALRESEETARILLNESKSSALLIDSKGIILQHNLQAVNFFELNGGEKDNIYESIKGSHYSEVFDRDCCDDFDRILEMSMSKGGDSFKRESDGKIYLYSFYVLSGSLGENFKIAVFKTDVTEIKKREDDLTSSVKRLTEIIEFLPEATFAVDTGRKVIAWNNAMESLTGIKKDDILGKANFYPFYGDKKPLLVDVLLDKMTGVSKDKISDDSMAVTIKCDSTLGKENPDLLAKASCFYGEDGEIAGAIETIRDITDLKRVGIALEKSEKRYCNIVEEQSDMLCRFSFPDMKISYVNRVLCGNLDFSKDELTGNTISIIFPENVCREVEKYNLSPFKECRPLCYETQIIENGEKSYWHEWKINPVFDGEKNVVEFQCVGRDITARKEAEIKLRESEEKYRFLIEKSKLILIGLDSSGRITSFNEFAEKIYGYSEKEAVGKKFAGFLTPLTDSTGRDLEYLIANVCKHPKNYPVDENETLTKDGRIKWISWSFNAIEDPAGLQAGILCVGSDITEKKTFEDIGKKRKKDLTILSRSASVMSRIRDKNDFYDYLSSELKNAVSYSVILITLYSKRSGHYYKKILKWDIDDSDKMLCNMLDLNLNNLDYEFNENYKKLLVSKEFLKTDDGFYSMFHRKIPKEVCNYMNELIDAEICYIKGLVWNNELLGTVSFIQKKDEPPVDTLLFNTLINYASSFIRRFSEENILEKISEGTQKIVNPPVLIKNGFDKLSEKRDVYLEYLVKMEREVTKNCLNCIEKAMIGVDINGQIVRINKAGCDLLGCREEVVLGKQLYNFFPEDIRDETMKIHNELTNGTSIRKMSISSELMNDTGGNSEILWDANRITDDLGNTMSLLWVGNL